MELHESLYALGQRLGLEVFDDPDSFRGALDDFLDEEAATTGDINLLVDAVRLGAFAAMTSMLRSGASVPAAIEEAGNRLARDRGGADVAGAQWACGMLAFAIGKASDPELRRYRTQQAIPQQTLPPLPTTKLPENSPAPAPPPPPTSELEPVARKRKTWVPIVAAAVAVAVVAGLTAAVLATRGGDDDGGPTGRHSTGAEELAMDMDSVQERYAGLADDVTVGVDECEPADAGDRATERLTCAFINGTLTLTTFENIADLERHRSANTGTDPGSRLSTSAAGTIYSLEKSALSDVETSSLYWDSTEALQAGTYVAASERVKLAQLVGLYRDIGGSAVYPLKPEDDGLIALATEFLDLAGCERIQIEERGELEESLCYSSDDVYIYMGVFEAVEDFEAYRRVTLDQVTGGADEKYWTHNDDRQGALAEYVVDGTAVLYWDRAECRCYMMASLESGDEDALKNWWSAPVA